jgi:diaminopimelate epimerase
VSIAARTFVAAVGGGHVVWRKHPSAIEQITVNLASVLHSDETVQTATWTLDSGLTNAYASTTTTTATTLIATGTAGTDYLVTLSVVTQGGYGRTILWTCTVQVRSPVV